MGKFKKSLLSGLLLTGLILCMVPVARPGDIPDRGPIPFAVYDKDGNGLISEQEFNTVRAERMATRAGEGRPMRGVANAPAFSDFDSNGDGSLTADELAAGQQSQFQKRRGMGSGINRPAFADLDQNGDGKILEEEFNAVHERRMAEHMQKGYQGKNAGAYSFADIDLNSDGEISDEEFAAHQSRCRMQNTQ